MRSLFSALRDTHALLASVPQRPVKAADGSCHCSRYTTRLIGGCAQRYSSRCPQAFWRRYSPMDQAALTTQSSRKLCSRAKNSWKMVSLWLLSRSVGHSRLRLMVRCGSQPSYYFLSSQKNATTNIQSAS